MKWLNQRRKAIVGFLVAFVGALMAQVQSGSVVDDKTLLLALGTAIVTGGAVHQTSNGE